MKCVINNKAFSLIELLVAVAILAIGIGTVLQAMAHSARVTGLSKDIVSALFLTEDKIQELEFKERASDKFAWEYALVLDADLDLYKLDLKTSWQRIGRNEEIDLETYLKK
jgi:prepilin-type N-terminal cleavage/methylation domain-containing protein